MQEGSAPLITVYTPFGTNRDTLLRGLPQNARHNLRPCRSTSKNII